MANNKSTNNILIMLSTHGTYSTTRMSTEERLFNKGDTSNKISEEHKENEGKGPTMNPVVTLEQYFKDARDNIYNEVNKTSPNSKIYIGYDGDGIQGDNLVPPTLLLCMLIDKFHEYEPTVIQSQGHVSDYGLPGEFNQIANYLNDNKDFDSYFDDKQKVINILKKEPKKEPKKDDSNKHITIIYTTPLSGNYTDNKLNECKLELAKHELKPSQHYEVYNLGALNGKYGGLHNNRLAGSTNAWQQFFQNNKFNLYFDTVYYAPVWHDSLCKVKYKKDGTNEGISYYSDSITKGIRDAIGSTDDINSRLFTNYTKNIIIIDKVYDKDNSENELDINTLVDSSDNPNYINVGGGGRRGSKRRSINKQKSSKRKSNRTLFH